MIAAPKNKGPDAVQRIEPHQEMNANGSLLEPRESTKTKQRSAVLAALRLGPLTTVQGRELLGVLHVGGRIMDLRRQGFRIETRSRVDLDAKSRPHRVACYVLLPAGCTP